MLIKKGRQKGTRDGKLNELSPEVIRLKGKVAGETGDFEGEATVLKL